LEKAVASGGAAYGSFFAAVPSQIQVSPDRRPRFPCPSGAPSAGWPTRPRRPAAATPSDALAAGSCCSVAWWHDRSAAQTIRAVIVAMSTRAARCFGCDAFAAVGELKPVKLTTDAWVGENRERIPVTVQLCRACRRETRRAKEAILTGRAMPGASLLFRREDEPATA